MQMEIEIACPTIYSIWHSIPYLKSGVHSSHLKAQQHNYCRGKSLIHEKHPENVRLNAGPPIPPACDQSQAHLLFRLRQSRNSSKNLILLSNFFVVKFTFPRLDNWNSVTIPFFQNVTDNYQGTPRSNFKITLSQCTFYLWNFAVQ